MRNLKRALSLALASVMLLGMMVVGSSAASYPDVDTADNLEAIDVLQMLGLMEGDTAGNFNPDRNVTRYEMTAIICKLLGLTPGGNSPFTDFGPSDNWAKPYVAACYNKGIVAGTSKTTFDGSRNMTAVEAGLMIMRTLNYFYNQSELGTNWKLATIREADAIDLYRGINVYTDQIMTRNDVAQMVLNALESDIVVARQGQSIDVATGDVSVNIQGQWTYESAENNTTKDYGGGAAKLTINGRQSLQLCEKLYGEDLRKNVNGANDEMGRPSSQWTYKGKSVTSPNEPDEIYTKAVKGKDIYSDLGKPSTLDLVEASSNKIVYVDGVATELSDAESVDKVLNKAGFKVEAGNDVKIGGNGWIVEVYYDNTKNEKNLTLVVIKPVVDQIDDVDENDDGQRIVKIGKLEFVTNSFEEDDWVVYTQNASSSDDADTIQSMYALEAQTGTLTKTVGDDKVTIDGKEYTLSKYVDDDHDYDVKDEVDFYLDANGYVAKIEQSEAVISVDSLAYVSEVNTSRGSDYAVLRLSDGTKKVVDTDKKYDGSDGDNLVGQIVSFKEDKNGSYKLSKRDGVAKDDTKNTAITFDKGTPTISYGSSKIATDSKTVFVYKAGSEVKVYTGYKNAPSVAITADNARFVVAAVKSGKAATMVYIEVPEADSSMIKNYEDIVFVAFDKDVKITNEGDGTEYYKYNAIVDGEISTVMVNKTIYTSNIVDDGKNGIRVLKDLSMDGDDIVDGVGSVTAGTDYYVATATEKVKNDTIGMGIGTYAYTDDVKVFFVDDDLNITEKRITDIKKCDNFTDSDARYAQVVFTLDDDEIDMIVVFEK